MGEKEEKPPDTSFIYVTRKCKLHKLMKNEYIHVVEDAVIRTHKIIRHTLQFMKYYYTRKYNETSDPNTILTPDINFVDTCMKFICNGTMKSREERPNPDPEKEKKRQLKRNLKMSAVDRINLYYRDYVST